MPDKMTLTERTVQRMFWHFHAGSCEFCCPNFTPVGWYECDKEIGRFKTYGSPRGA